MIGFLLFVLESHEILNAVCLCPAHQNVKKLLFSLFFSDLRPLVWLRTYYVSYNVLGNIEVYNESNTTKWRPCFNLLSSVLWFRFASFSLSEDPSCNQKLTVPFFFIISKMINFILSCSTIKVFWITVHKVSKPTGHLTGSVSKHVVLDLGSSKFELHIGHRVLKKS